MLTLFLGTHSLLEAGSDQISPWFDQRTDISLTSGSSEGVDLAAFLDNLSHKRHETQLDLISTGLDYDAFLESLSNI